MRLKPGCEAHSPVRDSPMRWAFPTRKRHPRGVVPPCVTTNVLKIDIIGDISPIISFFKPADIFLSKIKISLKYRDISDIIANIRRRRHQEVRKGGGNHRWWVRAKQRENHVPQGVERP